MKLLKLTNYSTYIYLRVVYQNRTLGAISAFRQGRIYWKGSLYFQDGSEYLLYKTTPPIQNVKSIIVSGIYKRLK